MLTVTCLILSDSRGHVLVTQRPFEKLLGGLWEFPGGKLEAHESPEEALRREIREELLLEVGELEPLTPVEHTYDFGTIRLLPFLTRGQKRPDVHLVEHMALRWIAPVDFESLEWAPADVLILAEIENLLRGV